MSREDQIIRWVSEGLEQFAEELKGYRVVLFGSRAAGQPKDRSDFDFGIYGVTPVSLKTFYKISDFLEQLPTLYQIDWVDLNRASDALRENALHEAKGIYG